MEEKKLVTILVPAYNEQEVLHMLYDRLKKLMDENSKYDFEILLVNDGSKDDSLKIMQELREKDKRVCYLNLSRNFGKEGGMYAGLENATGDYVAIMDADMQDPPEMVKTMYEDIKEEGYDCVALCSPNHKGYSPVRKLFTNWWYKLIAKISSTPQVPGARDFRLMNRKMVDAIVNMKEYKKEPEKYIGSIADFSSIVRMAITNKKNTPDIYSIMQLLGREKTINRMKEAMSKV